MTTKWLSEEEQRAWRAYLRMHARLDARLNRQLQADAGLSGADYAVLVALTDAPEGSLRPFELQRALEWEQSRLSHHLARMHKRGLVRRSDCAADARGAFVFITDQGRRAIESAAPAHVATVRGCFFDALTDKQVELVEELASTVLQRLDGDGGAPT